MDRGLYISMTGAAQNMSAQTLHANNLANANTTGFRADLAQARAQPLYGDGHPTRVYAMTENPAADFNFGALQETGNDLDVAISGDGWLAVVDADGAESYTRAGELKINAFGELISGSGLPVLGNGGPIAIPPYEKLEIGVDGTISVVEAGQEAQAITTLDRLKLVDPPLEELHKAESGLFRRRDGAVEPASAAVRIETGFLESSNVNVVSAMVDMISLTRNYELNVKMIQTSEQNSEISARLLQAN